MITGKFPNLRLRRSRKYEWSRRLIQENNLSVNDLILPIFLINGNNKRQPIKSMPGVFRYSIDKLNVIVGDAIKNRIPMIAFFPFTNKKNNSGMVSFLYKDLDQLNRLIMVIKANY